MDTGYLGGDEVHTHTKYKDYQTASHILHILIIKKSRNFVHTDLGKSLTFVLANNIILSYLT